MTEDINGDESKADEDNKSQSQEDTARSDVDEEEEENQYQVRVNALIERQTKVTNALALDDQLPTYSDVVEKYGWRAEICGDPFHLK